MLFLLNDVVLKFKPEELKPPVGEAALSEINVGDQSTKLLVLDNGIVEGF